MALSLDVPTTSCEDLKIETKINPLLSAVSLSDHYFLAYGDSVVSGSFGFGLKYHPYSVRLGEHLSSEAWSVVTAGVNNERTKDSIKRLKQLLASDNRSFEIVCISAGLNDLGDTPASATLMDNIQTLVNMALAHDSVQCVLLCTLPACPVDLSLPEYCAQKDAVNELIREYAAETPQVYLVDLAATFRPGDMTEEQREQFWDDHMHYSPTGSNEVGDLIHRVFNTVKKDLFQA